jgi:hypothetical protein
MRSMMTMVSLFAAVLAGCGASDGGGYGGSGYGAPPPSPAPTGNGPTLTVMNFLGWCSVAVNGGAGSTAATISVPVSPGSVASIVASPASGAFQIGPDPWLGTDEADGGPAPGADVGSGTAAETSTVTVTMSASGANRCVSVCCQEPGNAPDPCPATNPCP